MIDSVAGMMNAPPMPMNARVAISWSALVANADASEPRPKTTRPDLERAAAPEPVTQAARGEQQAGEHQRVGVDHPLQLAVRRVELAHDRRDRDVEDRVVEHDHEQAEAEDGEDPPATVVGVCLRLGELKLLVIADSGERMDEKRNGSVPDPNRSVEREAGRDDLG